MTEQEQGVTQRPRRSRAKVQRLVEEFKRSGMKRSQFCRQRQLALSTLKRHLAKESTAAVGPSQTRSRLVPVEVIRSRCKPQKAPEGCGVVAIVLAGGRRIEVQPKFDPQTLNRVVQVLEAL